MPNLLIHWNLCHKYMSSKKGVGILMKLEAILYSLIFFAACFMYLYLGIYLVRLNPRQKVNQAYFASITALFMWSFGYAVSNLSLDMGIALFWIKISAVGRISLFSIILHLMLLLTHTKDKLNKRWYLMLLHIPALLLTYVYVFSYNLAPLQYNLARYDFGWINNTNDNIWNRFHHLYSSLYILASVLMAWRWKRRFKTKTIIKQANLIIITIAIAILLIVLFDIIPSEMFHKPIPKMSSIFVLIPSWAMYYAARYYDIFNIESYEKDEIIVSDEEQKKIFVNLAIATIIVGIFIIVSEYFSLKRAGISDISLPLKMGWSLLGIGLILCIAQEINKKQMRETLSIVILIVSIPIVAIAFLKYSAITVWVFPIIIIMSSLLFKNRTLLIATTIVALGTQRLVWMMKASSYVLVNEYDYVIRMVAILTAFFMGAYINRVYITKIEENNYQIEFQKMISDISLDFVNLNLDNFESKVDNLLERIGNFFHVDRTYLFTIDHNSKTMTYSNEWSNTGIDEEVGTIEEMPLDIFPWWLDELYNKRLVYIEDVDNMPKEARAEQEQLHRQKVKSFVSVPIIGEDKIQAFIGIDSVLAKKNWTGEDIELLNIIANILTSGITQRNTDKRIEFMALYDNLTKLPNRFLFEDRVNQAINLSKDTGKFISIIFIDLDSFKTVNDTIGHKGGDILLKEVANSLAGVIRKTDSIARFGGDEFLIMINNMTEYDMVTKIAEKIMKVFSRTFFTNDQELLITASAGIAIYPEDGEDSETLIKNADIAMYKAKAKGKNQYTLCTREMKAEVETSIALSNDLYDALERNELLVYYQPQINLLTKRITGTEALLRWMHPTKGIIAPRVFIPLAEKSSLINRIGDWVLKEACIQNKKWNDMGITPINIAINLSAIQITNPDIVVNIQRIIEETGLDPKYIELEITENIAIQETNYVIDVLSRLKEIGVSIAIDDFGTEYSSLSRLKYLPIDRIKIDMQFIQGLETDDKDKAITMVIINLAKSLGMNVLAEGVETKAQVDFLIQKMCDNVQGFYYYRPMAAEQMEKILIDLSVAEDVDIFRYININSKMQ